MQNKVLFVFAQPGDHKGADHYGIFFELSGIESHSLNFLEGFTGGLVTEFDEMDSFRWRNLEGFGFLLYFE